MAGGGFHDRLAQERRGRLQAERLLAQRSDELYSANEKLAEHATVLSHQVIAQREQNVVLQGNNSRTQAALAVATEKADIAERRLWDALEAAEDGFAIFDKDWRLVVANPAYMGLFDGVADVAPGASYETVLRVAVDEGIVDLEGEQPPDWIERMIARWESTHIPQSDIKLWNGHYVRLIDKRTVQGDVVSLGVDITQTIRREQQLRAARDLAETANRAKSAFLANMSHEIRTPMNGVVSMAELLRETALTDEQKLYADTIKSSGEALLVIINDVLDYSKIEADKIVLHPSPFALDDLIKEIFNLLRPGLQGRSVTMQLDYDGFMPDRLMGDAGRIRQVLTNLIGNALKFTEKGHVVVRVAGLPQENGQISVRVDVEDTGIGIAPEMQGHVFGEFNQVEDQANRRFEGTGLGLAITQRLIQMMNGTVWLESEVGSGSVFGFSLPLMPAPGAVTEPVAPLPDGTPPVLILGGDTHRTRWLVAQLRRLRVPVEERANQQERGAFCAVILTDGKGVATQLLHLRDLGLHVPVGILNKAFDGPVPNGSTPLRHDIDLAALRRFLAPSQDQVGTTPPPPAVEGTGARTARLRVLAAEDNKTNQLVFRTMLKAADLDLTMVDDGQKLLEAYVADTPDIIFTDISMPLMDGLEATRKIRAHEREHARSPVPIIAMTAHAMDGDKDRILAAGIDEYLTKPLSKAGLLGMIDRFVPDQSLQDVKSSTSR